MTRRAASIQRRAGTGPLPVFHEMPAAGYLRPWLRSPEMSTRRFWEGIAHSHGQMILEKVREATPGCRPGFMYATGRLPPLPLIEEPPPDHAVAREFITIDGERYWHCRPFDGIAWLPCQAEHLRDAGFPERYRLSGGNRTIVGLHHLCH